MPVPLSLELAKKAEVELNETPQKLIDGIQHLKEWISKQPHLRARTDDQWLTAFLRGCKYSLERVKTKLDLYYSLRTISPDLFSLTHNDKRFKELLRTGAVLILPKLSKPTSPRVVLVRPGLYDPNKFSPSEFISLSHSLQQIMYMEDDAFVINGILNIVDMKGITMTHVLQMTPTQVKKLVVSGQDASPLRLKSLHFINSYAAVEKMFNLAIKLLNEKNRDKIHVYSKGMTALHDFVSLDTLPTEYGGQGGTTEEIIDYWVKKVEEYGPWFNEDLKYGTDESKRSGKPKTAVDMFGVEGSFRQLVVD